MGSTEQPVIDARAAERFWSRVDKNGPVPAHAPELGPCWIYCCLDGRPASGYGQFRVNGKQQPSNRAAWFFEHGAFPPPPLYVLHKCDVQGCVRPSHLYAGTARENSWDCLERGRDRWRTLAPGKTVRLTADDAVGIRYLAAFGVDFDRIADRFLCSENLVIAIAKGESWPEAGGPRLQRGEFKYRQHKLKLAGLSPREAEAALESELVAEARERARTSLRGAVA